MNTLPDILTNLNGEKTTADTWPARREEILSLLSEGEYGKIYDRESVHTVFTLLNREKEPRFIKVKTERLIVEAELSRGSRQHTFCFVIFLPLERKERIPVFLYNAVAGSEADYNRMRKADSWPMENIIARGYAAAAVVSTDIAPGFDDHFRGGFHRLFPEYAENRPDDAAGTLAAWAFGLSTVLDYLQTMPEIDGSKCAVVGHSRCGKAALWAAACDPRFHAVFSSCAGNSGDALARGNKGEKIANITTFFPYWFAGAYKQYADHEDDMPFDQHMLLAAIAPRYLYTSSKTEDAWADPEGQLKSLNLGKKAFELLGLCTGEELPVPELGVPVINGHVGYHRLAGPHSLTAEDWELYMDFFEKTL